MSAAVVAIVRVGIPGRGIRIPRVEGGRLPLRGRLLQHHLDRFLDVRQLSVAETGERHAFLEELELPLEPEPVGLDLGDDLLEPVHRLLERLLFFRPDGRRHSPEVSVAKSGPRSEDFLTPPWRTTARISPS